MIFERGDFRSYRTKETLISDSLKRSRFFVNEDLAFTTKCTVFLSHKHDDLKDLEEAKDVINLLESFGVIVYVDSMDNLLPDQTSGETAIRIKKVIKFCNKFILLATDRAIESFWCNWELGIGDVHKYIEHIAILPIKEKNTGDMAYSGNEYLQIYPSIDFENGTNKYKSTEMIIPKGYYVTKPKNKEGIRYTVPLKDWLKSEL